MIRAELGYPNRLACFAAANASFSEEVEEGKHRLSDLTKDIGDDLSRGASEASLDPRMLRSDPSKRSPPDGSIWSAVVDPKRQKDIKEVISAVNPAAPVRSTAAPSSPAAKDAKDKACAVLLISQCLIHGARFLHVVLQTAQFLC